MSRQQQAEQSDSGRELEYPYDDGYVIVLGPEIFAARDRSVISWQGENYVPQRTPFGRRIWRRRTG